ncbi:MAG: NAD(+) diphosphatase [Solirubrobacteraceae bacterium]|jgi:NAD+ diphosphatase
MSAADPIPATPRFTGMALDRATNERKDPAVIRRLLADPASRALSAGHDAVLIEDGSEPALLRSALAAGDDADEAILLGLDHGQALFAADVDAQPAVHGGARLVGLRDAGAVLSAPESGLAAYVVALLNWHRRHRFCANCGAATAIEEAGYARRCPRCHAVHFPRTDPVVIMTVEHDGRLLLGRRAGWPPGRLSVLAGFVSPGEAAEEAVVREVQEESGIVARDPVFVSSQPWPFPASLMLGFHAVSDGGEPRARDGELEEVHWLGLDAVRAALGDAGPGFALPPSVSIARFLIERWVAHKDA